ncbi:hypothetical protein K2173_002692 [Erythroxylum novogranatense]|uniref:Uncharacterized protein n=1 Tax=Erythroxylum novogranatense TaxID=1862640 RepID=A0AAV8SY04_9ROSI|nr:hypothetical protein K2173_002692 [Erythroxylum novogranatense]
MGRQPCCEKAAGLKRGPWNTEEDQKLMNFILNNGIQCWRQVPKLAGLLRCGKSCRLRWMNYLRPDLKRGALSEEEEKLIIELHSRFGNRWSKIAAHLPGRTDNEIKNHWNTRIRKKIQLLGINPPNHRPIEQVDKCEVKLAESLEDTPERNGRVFNQVEDKPFCSGTPVLTNKTSSEEMDGGSTLTRQNEQSDSFSSRTNEPVMTTYSHQYWVDHVNSLFSWDGFNSLEDLFPFDKP